MQITNLLNINANYKFLSKIKIVAQLHYLITYNLKNIINLPFN